MTRHHDRAEPRRPSHRVHGFRARPSELLEPLLRELFEQHWRGAVFGYCIQGAVSSCAPAQPPRLSLLDGYLTVDLDGYATCICASVRMRGPDGNPTPPEIAAWRRVGRAAFYRSLNREGAPVSWGLRMWNGRGEQMLTVFLPNPYYDCERSAAGARLATARRCGIDLRSTYFDLPPQAAGPGDDARSARLTGCADGGKKGLARRRVRSLLVPGLRLLGLLRRRLRGAGYLAAALSSSSFSMSAMRFFIWSYLYVPMT